ENSNVARPVALTGCPPATGRGRLLPGGRKPGKTDAKLVASSKGCSLGAGSFSHPNGDRAIGGDYGGVHPFRPGQLHPDLPGLGAARCRAPLGAEASPTGRSRRGRGAVRGVPAVLDRGLVLL